MDTPEPQLRLDASRVTKLVVLLVVAGLYMAACATPAVNLDKENQHGWGLKHEGCAFSGHFVLTLPTPNWGDQPGVVALLFGWLSPWWMLWSANLFAFAGWYFLLRGWLKIALALGALGTVLGFATPFVRDLRLLLGYYLWEASMIALAAGVLLLAVRVAYSRDLAGRSLHEPVAAD